MVHGKRHSSVFSVFFQPGWGGAWLILLGLIVGMTTGCTTMHDTPRTIHAEVVALEQPIMYNRFGSMNPYGMMYALKHDVVNKSDGRPMDEHSTPGQVQLKEGKRPRPLVLRANPGDHLVVHFYNMLSPDQPDLSSTHWEAPYANLNEQELPSLPGESEVGESHGPPISGQALTDGCGSDLATRPSPNPANRRNDWPRTRCASLMIAGLAPVGNTFDPQTTGIAGIPPGQSMTYQWDIASTAKPSTHLFSVIRPRPGVKGMEAVWFMVSLGRCTLSRLGADGIEVRPRRRSMKRCVLNERERHCLIMKLGLPLGCRF